jgi:hypothetical protein
MIHDVYQPLFGIKYEVNIPTNQNKIRLSRPCDADYRWLINKTILFGKKGTINLGGASFRGECQILLQDGSKDSISCDDIVKGQGAYLLSNCKPPKRKNAGYQWLDGGEVLIGRKGVVKDAPRDDSSDSCRVLFEDGSEETISCDDAVKGAFSFLLQGIGLDHQYVWPGTEKTNVVEHNETSALPTKPTIKAEKRGRKKATSSAKRVSIKLEDDNIEYEPIAGHRLLFRTDTPVAGVEAKSALDDSNVDPDAEFRFIGKKKIALPLPPGIPNMLWHALNCPEAKVGYNLLQDFLFVHDRVPGQDLVSVNHVYPR